MEIVTAIGTYISTSVASASMAVGTSASTAMAVGKAATFAAYTAGAYYGTKAVLGAMSPDVPEMPEMGFERPSISMEAPTMPAAADQRVQQAKSMERKRAAAASGMRSTIKTSPLGVPAGGAAMYAQKKLLGQ